MPFDSDRLDCVRKALGSTAAGYREAAVVAADEVEALLRSWQDAGAADHAPAFTATLGSLGAVHIDTGRLATLFGEEARLSGAALEAVQEAAAVLREIARAPDPGPLALPPGGNLAQAVGEALARVGRAYGAAHVVSLARTGRFDRKAHASWLRVYPFSRWNRRERQLVPPIVVTLEGSDLRAGGLAEFLDGALKLVLLVRDEIAPPAPLVRLLTPGVYLTQTQDGTQMDQLTAWHGPGVLAWVPPCSAAFVHDPAAGPTLGARLRMLSDPPAPRRGIGGLSATQLTEELRQLEAIAGLANLGAAAASQGPGAGQNPVDRLAAWILSQAAPADALGEAGT